MSNFIQLIEVCEGPTAVFSRRKISENMTSTTIQRDYTLRKVICNTEHISFLKENIAMKERFEKDRAKFPEDLDERQSFTSIQIGSSKLGMNSSITVIGSLEMIFEKLSGED